MPLNLFVGLWPMWPQLGRRKKKNKNIPKLSFDEYCHLHVESQKFSNNPHYKIV